MASSSPSSSRLSQKTLLQLADERRRFAQLQRPPQASPSRADRILDALVWTATLAMLHFTFDLLVQHQYATDISWPLVCLRAARAWMVFFLLFYALHPYSSHDAPLPLPSLPPRWHHSLRQAIFFGLGLVAACRLVFVSNTAGYLATMKQTPPLACLCIWAVIELALPLAMLCLALVALYIHLGDYHIK
ncbi:hypothetical protein CDD81_1915 [Ophiocordyceps australis]|uniref:DUF7719 domain-containing protein n=1 Tax=Ophiocordyceps australis TaxID=1399860 RepID=A0A2C5XXV5_9HYPO|nr:hypothetical protein CDD81_1915 [Ophiocordyceps australis]